MRKWKLARLCTLLVCMALTLTLGLAVTACGKQPVEQPPAVSSAKPLDQVEARAAKTLRLAGVAYSNIMGAAGEAADKGLITEAQWTRIAASAEVFYSTFHTARLALIQYHKAPGESGSKEKLMAALVLAVDNWRSFASYVAPLVGLPVPDIEKE